MRLILPAVLLTASLAALASADPHGDCGLTPDNAIPLPLDTLRPLDRPLPESAQALRGGASLEDGSRIDILVLYTPAARAASGGVAQIESEIDFGWGPLDQAAFQSGIDIDFHIVGKVEINYTESGAMSTDLARLREPSDGFIDEAHDLRDLYMADIVMLVVNSGDVCGIANIGVGPGNTATPENAFGVVGRACMPPSTMAFAHEVGHTLGLLHGWDEYPCNNGGATYAKGYVEPTDAFMTVMGTGNALREPYFSNPDVLRFGVLPTGVPIGEPEEANAAAAILAAAPVVARYRDRDVNANGILDTDEIAAGTLADCNANNYPDIAEQDFNRNAIPDDCDIAAATSLDANFNGVPDEVELPTIMVDRNAQGNNTGGWADACTDLQDALALARALGVVQEIWVAAGVYTPASDGQRARQFDLVSGVTLRGGFAGTETTPAERPDGLMSVLSGDQFQNDNLPGEDPKADNSLHVLRLIRQSESITIERFIVEGGFADSNLNCGGFMDHGGGLFAYSGDLTIHDCEFRDNAALIGGGLTISNIMRYRVFNNDIHHNTAIVALAATAEGTHDFRGYAGGVQLNSTFGGADAQFINNRVRNNTDFQFVSGVYLLAGSPIFANNLIADNISMGTYSGAGLYLNLADEMSIVNCTITGNTAPVAFPNYAAGLVVSRSDHITVSNSIIWGNTVGQSPAASAERNQIETDDDDYAVNNSIVTGWTGTLIGAGTIDADPMFSDPISQDYTPAPASPAIDMGDNAALPLDHLDLDADADTAEQLPIDLNANPRVVDDPDTSDTGPALTPLVDAGAFEFQPEAAPSCPADFTGDGALDIFDVFAFLNAYENNLPGADFTSDGVFDIFDVFAFLGQYENGCP